MIIECPLNGQFHDRRDVIITSRMAVSNNFITVTVMASLDLSMSFDMVDTNLLIKRLRVIGMPNDLIKLIKEWLVGRV